MDAQPISNPERLMMASEMDMDEAEEEAMAIVADELGIKMGAKVRKKDFGAKFETKHA